MALPSGVAPAVSIASAAVLVGLGVRNRHNWESPAGVSFSVLTVTMGTFALGAVVVAVAGAGGDPGLQFVNVAAAWLVVFPYVWFVFTLEYLGYHEFVRWPYLVAFAIPTGGAALVWLLTPTVSGSSGALIQLLQVGAGTTMFVGGILGALVAALVVRAGFIYDYLDELEGLSIGFVGFVHLATVVGTSVVNNLGVGPQQTAWKVLFASNWGFAAVALTVAFVWVDFMEVLPGTSEIGPEQVVEEMDEPMIVVDTDDCVLELNPQAEATFDTADVDVVGRGVPQLLGYSLSELRVFESVELPTVKGHREFETSVSEVRDHRDRTFGYVILFHDVTRQRRREQRLSVLNRVLRHNLRNDMTAVLTCASILAENGQDSEQLAERIYEGARELVDTGEKAREVEQLMAVERDPERVIALRSQIDRVVEQVEATVGTDWDCTVSVDPTLTVRADDRILEPVLYNLVENAVEHGSTSPETDASRDAVEHSSTSPETDASRDAVEHSSTSHADAGASADAVERADSDVPQVTVDAETDGETVVVEISDDGPGIPEYEQQVLVDGEETDLEHGSGLGLWTVRWGVARLGGDVAFENTDPGAVVRLALPDGNAAPGTEVMFETDDAAIVSFTP